MNIPLFPLNSIILPGGRIPLQLFEPRYIDMLTRCLKEDGGFAIVLLREGEETDTRARFYDLGTRVRIVDFQQLENGLLGITVEGDAKVAVLDHWQAPDGLHMGRVELLEEESDLPVPDDQAELAVVLKALLRHPVVRDLGMTVDFDSAREVGWRLAELLPIDKTDKQRLLELQDPLDRLDHLYHLLQEME